MNMQAYRTLHPSKASYFTKHPPSHSFPQENPTFLPSSSNTIPMLWKKSLNTSLHDLSDHLIFPPDKRENPVPYPALAMILLYWQEMPPIQTIKNKKSTAHQYVVIKQPFKLPRVQLSGYLARLHCLLLSVLKAVDDCVSTVHDWWATEPGWYSVSHTKIVTRTCWT